MSPPDCADIAIVGAGLAGLRLASALRQRFPALKVLLQGPDDGRQQRLSFWQPRGESSAEDDVIDARWRHWRVVHRNRQIRHTGERYDYVSLDALQLKQRLGAQLATMGCIRRQSLLLALQPVADRVLLHTGDGTVEAACVIDTRPPTPTAAALLQQFLGQTLVSQHDHGLQEPVLMNFDVPAVEPSGVYFLYVLPLTSRRLLLEYTGFVRSPQDTDALRDGLQQAIRQHYPDLYTAAVESEECGLIPMGPVVPQAQGKRILPFGVAGGAARTATGYAFCGISRQIDGLLRQLAVTGPGPGLLCPAAYSWRTRALDRVFLQVLRAEPARMADIIGSMASGLRGDDFAAFLSDSDGWWPALRTIWQVPKRPFLRAVAEQATLGRRHG